MAATVKGRGCHASPLLLGLVPAAGEGNTIHERRNTPDAHPHRRASDIVTDEQGLIHELAEPSIAGQRQGAGDGTLGGKACGVLAPSGDTPVKAPPVPRSSPLWARREAPAYSHVRGRCVHDGEAGGPDPAYSHVRGRYWAASSVQRARAHSSASRIAARSGSVVGRCSWSTRSTRSGIAVSRIAPERKRSTAASSAPQSAAG